MTEYEVGFSGRLTVRAENEAQAKQITRKWHKAIRDGQWPESSDPDAPLVNVYVDLGKVSSAEEGREFHYQIWQKARASSVSASSQTG